MWLFGWNFFLVWLSVYRQKINVIRSFYEGIYVIKASCNYSKIGNNINFHLSTYAEKINDKIFHNKGKIPFCGHYQAHFAVLAQRKFFLKKSTYVQLQRSPSIPISEIQSGLAIKPKITPSLSACKNHSIILLNLSNYLWYTWFKSRMVYRIFLTMSTQ